MDAVYLKKIVKMEGGFFEMKGYIIAGAAIPATLFLLLTASIISPGGNLR